MWFSYFVVSLSKKSIKYENLEQDLRGLEMKDWTNMD